MISDRIEKLRQQLARKEIDAMFISQTENRYYMSGFDGSAGYLLITNKDAILATDFRYVEQVKRESPDYTLFEIKGRLIEWFPKLIDSIDMRRLGFESTDMTFAYYHELVLILDKVNPKLRLVPVEGIVENLRAIKEPDEIVLIQKAAKIGDAAFEKVTEKLKPGVTELEIAWQIERMMRETGSQSVPFEVIVAAGPNSALPHAKPSNRPVKAGEPVVIDIGAKYKGYSSDLTRTIFLGNKPDPQFKVIYDIVLKAQETAINGIKENTTGVQADALARNIIKEAGYGDKFGHGLGHGVGLATHDPSPRLSALARPDPIVDGMVFSIEPGIYLPEWGGVRIEDLAVLENGKVRLLSHAKKWQSS